MSRLHTQVSRDGQMILDRDADECTVLVLDTKTDKPVVSSWGDGSDGLWIHYGIEGEEEPERLVPEE